LFIELVFSNYEKAKNYYINRPKLCQAKYSTSNQIKDNNMSNWSLEKPPTYFPTAVATTQGWTDPTTGEVYVAIANLTGKQPANWPTSVTFTLAVPANGTYEAGQTLTFTVTASHQVVVQGTPSLDVTIGTNVRQAAFTGIDATGKILTFAYVLQPGDDDANGIAVANTIDLNTVGTGKSRVVDTLTLNSGESIPVADLTFTVPVTTGILTAG
jgi:hypothetical protein